MERGPYVYVDRKTHYIFLKMWDLPPMVCFPGHDCYNPQTPSVEDEIDETHKNAYESKRKKKKGEKEKINKEFEDDLYGLLELSHLNFRATEDDIKASCKWKCF